MTTEKQTIKLSGWHIGLDSDALWQIHHPEVALNKRRELFVHKFEEDGAQYTEVTFSWEAD